jgi:hypothetical protein
MALRFDPGGPDWRQLVSWVTLRQRRMSGDALVPGRHTDSEKNPLPVVAKFNLFVYWTVDWPRIRLHFMPAIVLWNPYSEPMQAREWYVRHWYGTQHMEGFMVKFRASHPDWRNGQSIWSPQYRVRYQSGQYDTSYTFRLQATEIPAGAAVMFTMDGHQEVALHHSNSDPDTIGVTSFPRLTGSADERNFVVNPTIDLKPGWHGGQNKTPKRTAVKRRNTFSRTGDTSTETGPPKGGPFSCPFPDKTLEV